MGTLMSEVSQWHHLGCSKWWLLIVWSYKDGPLEEMRVILESDKEGDRQDSMRRLIPCVL